MLSLFKRIRISRQKATKITKLKTALSIASVYCNAKNSHTNSIIMCPGHLVEKWKREIERLFPDAKAVIINEFNDLYNIEKELTCALRSYPLFLIISKDTAKISYQERPTAVYDSRNHQFLCPNCGSPLYTTKQKLKYCNHIRRKRGVSDDNVTVNEMSVKYLMQYFLDKGSHNAICCSIGNRNRARYAGKMSMKEISNNSAYDTCKSSLWACTSSQDKNSKWIKHTSVGWLNTDLIPQYKEWYEKLPLDDGDRNDNTYKKLYNAIIDIEENGIPRQVAPRRYSIARFIREKFRHYIDYFIADEVHLYSSGSSAQANAFGDLVRCANKTIALTGTLLNGYADGIYYILYRMYSRDFKKKNYSYDTTVPFVNNYGVKRESRTTRRSANGYSYNDKLVTKTCPGVSPELFTDFLLDKAVFISLSDMSNALPSYTETPIAIEMEQSTREQYNKVTTELKNLFQNRNIDNTEIAFMAAQKLSLYPDMPYNMSPIYSTRTGKILLNFPDAIENSDDYVSNKDLKVLEIVKEKVEKGENVLIYVNFVNKIDCIDRLEKMLKLSDIKTCVLDAKVKSSAREQWIDKKIKDGYRVMICNPTLVETGLDLLAFTNIIFYQVGYNLFTMRQASRRSLRLNQVNDVNVYFLYYKNTTQEVVLSLMANKLQAAMAIEGKFTEEGLNAMSNNDDILTQIADSLINNIEHKIEEGSFTSGIGKAEDEDKERSRFKLIDMLNNVIAKDPYSFLKNTKKKENISVLALCS